MIPAAAVEPNRSGYLMLLERHGNAQPEVGRGTAGGQGRTSGGVKPVRQPQKLCAATALCQPSDVSPSGVRSPVPKSRAITRSGGPGHPSQCVRSVPSAQPHWLRLIEPVIQVLVV